MPLSFTAFPGAGPDGELFVEKFPTSGGLAACLVCSEHFQMIMRAQMVSTTEEVVDEHFVEL
jgi:hypothetical protein